MKFSTYSRVVGPVNPGKTVALATVLALTACPGGGETTTTTSSTTDVGTTTGTTGDIEPTGGTTGDTSTTDAPTSSSTTGSTTDPVGTTDTTDTASTTDVSTSTTDASTSTTDTTGGSSSTGADAVCGDGEVEQDEACDDANAGLGDGCTAECTRECTALHFEGKTIAQAANPTTLHTISVTAAGWHKADATAPYGSIFTKSGKDVGGHVTYSVATGNTGTTARLQVGLEAFLDLTAPTVKPDGKWHHFALTYDAVTGNGVLYVDGVVVDSEKKGMGLVAANPALPFSIGAEPLMGKLFYASKADITDVVVYGTALTAGEVKGLIDGVYPPLALAFYPTPEGMGAMSEDVSGNGHTLTVPDGGWAADGPYCVDAVCGNGEVDADEACDDADHDLGDGCTSACKQECTALHFEGKTLAQAADPVKLHTVSLTAAGWHKAAANAPYGVIFVKAGKDVGGHSTYAIATGMTGTTARLQVGLEAFLDLTAPMAKSDGMWHHYALTYDAATGNGVLYRDGVVLDSEKKGMGLVAANPALPFSIGAEPLMGQLFYASKADITDVVVYGTALGEADVMGLVEGVYPPAPLAFYPTPEGTGLMSQDMSGNGHTLTVPVAGWAADGPYCAP
ncbi:MAG TPA: LamG-like jellyroll fold domain-containing protein [Nannocystis sp.]